MISNLALKQGVAEWLTGVLTDAGGDVESVTINSDYFAGFGGSSENAWNYHVAVAPYCYDPVKREEIAASVLSALADVSVIRDRGNILLHGESEGVTWCIDVGRGVCEQVQVGTRLVEKPDPEYVKSAPMVTVEEPVFEVRCVDPLAVR